MPAAYTSACSLQVSDFEDLRLLIPCIRLYAVPVRRASALPAASFRSYLTIATLAVRLTLPPVGCVKNFHASFKSAVIFKQMRPAGHTQKKGSSFIWTTLDSGNIPLKSQNGRSSFSSETDGGAPGAASSRPSDPPADSPRSWREPSMTRSFATISVTYRLLPSLPS